MTVAQGHGCGCYRHFFIRSSWWISCLYKNQSCCGFSLAQFWRFSNLITSRMPNGIRERERESTIHLLHKDWDFRRLSILTICPCKYIWERERERTQCIYYTRIDLLSIYLFLQSVLANLQERERERERGKESCPRRVCIQCDFASSPQTRSASPSHRHSMLVDFMESLFILIKCLYAELRGIGRPWPDVIQINPPERINLTLSVDTLYCPIFLNHAYLADKSKTPSNNWLEPQPPWLLLKYIQGFSVVADDTQSSRRIPKWLQQESLPASWETFAFRHPSTKMALMLW